MPFRSRATALRPLFAALLLTTAVGACATDSSYLTSEPLPERIESHVATLASDEFGGRGTGTLGYEQAAEYVADFFERVGVAPGAENYRQDVPLVAIDPDSISGDLTVSVNGQPLDLEVGETVGFYPPSDMRDGAFTAEGAGQIIFVGNGVVAPELGMNAYDGVDVDGKVVMMFRGAGEIEDNAYDVHLRRFDVKRREAAERGAVGILYVDQQDRDIGRLTAFRANHKDGALALGAGLDEPMPTALIGLDPVRELFQAAGLELDDVVEYMEAGNPVSMPLAATASLRTSADITAVDRAFNVVGVVPGNDPALAGEAVVVTAHLDHLGQHNDERPEGEGGGEDEDTIYNGALDNATGTAILMEAAAKLAAEGGARRSVIFAALTAEEAGLLGAAHLARNIETLGYEPVANVNIDMPVLTYPLNDIIGFGEKYSTLGAHLTAAAEEVGLTATPDPLPELSLFVRSDHYRFVQEGIPALFLFNGMSGEGKENFQKFMATHYHKPSDEVTLPIDWGDAATFTRLSTGLIERIANDEKRPEWNEGVLFAPTRPQG